MDYKTRNLFIGFLAIIDFRESYQHVHRTNHETFQLQEYDSSNYTNGEHYNDQRPTLECYACIYSSIDSHGHKNCDKVLNPQDIPVKQCDTSCQMFYSIVDSTNYFILRDCGESCHEQINNGSFTKCCQYPLCNHFNPGRAAPTSTTLSYN